MPAIAFAAHTQPSPTTLHLTISLRNGFNKTTSSDWTMRRDAGEKKRGMLMSRRRTRTMMIVKILWKRRSAREKRRRPC
jgi:hypothetical protein